MSEFNCFFTIIDRMEDIEKYVEKTDNIFTHLY